MEEGDGGVGGGEAEAAEEVAVAGEEPYLTMSPHESPSHGEPDIRTSGINWQLNHITLFGCLFCYPFFPTIYLIYIFMLPLAKFQIVSIAFFFLLLHRKLITFIIEIFLVSDKMDILFIDNIML